MSTAVVRRHLSVVASLGLALSLSTAAFAQNTLAGEGSIPDKTINRDLVRRALLDTCVYGEAAKEGAKKEKVVDACQCASFKVMKGVKDEVVAKIAADRSVPDELFRATTEAYGTCVR